MTRRTTFDAITALISDPYRVDYVAHRGVDDQDQGHWSFMISKGSEWAEGKFPVGASSGEIARLVQAMVREVDTEGVDYAEAWTLAELDVRDFTPPEPAEPVSDGVSLDEIE